MKNMDTYAIRLYINGKRKLSHKLTNKQASMFLFVNSHLASYLKEAYKVKPFVMKGK